MNHQESADFTSRTRGIIRQEDTTEHLVQKLRLLPLSSINDMRSTIRLQMFKHYQSLEEGWLLDHYRIRNTINSDELKRFHISNNQ
jgi:hypothetical protein